MVTDIKKCFHDIRNDESRFFVLRAPEARDGKMVQRALAAYYEGFRFKVDVCTDALFFPGVHLKFLPPVQHLRFQL